MTENANVNVKNIKCSGPLTFHAARIAIDVNYLMEEINNGLYSGRASIRDEAFKANTEIAELLSKLQSDLKTVSSRLQKNMRSTTTTRRTNGNTPAKAKSSAKPKGPAATPAKAKATAKTTTATTKTKNKPTAATKPSVAAAPV